jgi:hypothetical protein
VPDVKVQMFRAGMSPNRITANDLMTGNPVTGVRDLGPAAGVVPSPLISAPAGRAACTTHSPRTTFFWKITIKYDVMTRVAQWRDLGRPEAALIRVEY